MFKGHLGPCLNKLWALTKVWGQLQMLLFPNALCCSLYEHNCVCAVTKFFTKFLPVNNFCQLLRVTRKRSCTFAMINRGRLELATSPTGPRACLISSPTHIHKHCLHHPHIQIVCLHNNTIFKLVRDQHCELKYIRTHSSGTGHDGIWGKSILQVPDTGTRALDNTRQFLHSSIESFWITPACSKEHKYHIFRQYWYTRNVPVFINTGTFQYLGPQVYFFRIWENRSIENVPV